MGKNGLIWVIQVYRYLFKPMLPACCRFMPSCSEYAIASLKRYGLIKGSWLTVVRLLCCHPWHEGGVDEVP